MQQQYRSSMLAALGLYLAACANATPVVEMKGACVDANTAQICTYAQVQGDAVSDVGMTLPIASVENSKPGVPSMDWPPKRLLTSALPAKATEQSGLTELTMYFESTGHPPAPYLIPHFDFHFYFVPDADVAAIDCKDTAKPAQLPDGYALPDQPLPPDMQKMMGVSSLVGICVPGMGMHSLPAKELASTTPFDGTMVVGYYHAKPIFIEPMISRDMLLKKQSFTLAIPFIPGVKGRHPTTFHADYDAAKQLYKFRFSDFKAG